MYKIKYFYMTGDSFGHEDREDVLEYEWGSLEVATEALNRIKEHYKWYEEMNHTYSYRDTDDRASKPEWHKVTGIRESDEHNLINIPMDDGTEVQFWPPWCGYFESLYSAEIVEDLPKFVV